MKNFFAVFLFAVGFGAWYAYHYTHETREALAEGTEQLASHEKMVADREAEFAAIVNALELSKKVAGKQKELADLQARQQVIDQQAAALQKQKSAQVSVNRQIMIGTVFTDLTLSDGRKFPEARISKIDDSSVSFTVPAGIIKVKPSELSPEVKQVLQYK